MRAASRRPTIRRIVIAAVLLLAILEPLVMYRSLVREREHRLQAFAQMLSVDDAPGSAGR